MRNTLTKLAERLGVEPSQRFNTLYGLAIRCLTVRPPLQVLYYICEQISSQMFFDLIIVDSLCLNFDIKSLLISGSAQANSFMFGSPRWVRTTDLRINSPSLYRLSYQGILEQRVRFELTGLRICNPLHWATLPPLYITVIEKCLSTNLCVRGFRATAYG